MTLTTFDNLEQGSEEWLAARRGMVTASTVGKLISYDDRDPADFDCHVCGVIAGAPCVSVAKGKTGPIKTFHPARYEVAREAGPALTVDARAVDDFALLLAAERLTGDSEDNYVSNDMFRGIMAEPVARDAYSKARKVDVAEIGFMVREENGWKLGWSPDGLIAGKAGIEIKAPRAKTHIKTILADEVPGLYMPQCQAALLVSGREYIDFISFYGGLPLYTKRVLPDPDWFAIITDACREVEHAVTQIIAAFTERAAGLPPTERLDLDLEMS